MSKLFRTLALLSFGFWIMAGVSAIHGVAYQRALSPREPSDVWWALAFILIGLTGFVAYGGAWLIGDED